MISEKPIAIFDSGVGGLTVVRSVQELLPQEHIIYFGDTARFPYGPRPIEEVRRFALEVMDQMIARDVKMLVIACNAMTAAAFEDAGRRYDVPVIGVIAPGVRAGIRATRNGRIGVLGTKATIESGQYDRALRATGTSVEIFSAICPAFVEAVETGDTFSPELIRTAEDYLAPLTKEGIDTLILGCTHYPLLIGVLHWVTKGEVLLISSADEVAKDVYAQLVDRSLLRRVMERGYRRFMVSGDPGHFLSVAGRFIPEIEGVEGAPWPEQQLLGEKA